ncbi:MAG: hypothetical protein ACFFE8_06305 [Candidatus Heimdallarchaeota archaeon]
MTNDQNPDTLEVKPVTTKPNQWDFVIAITTASVTNVSIVFFIISILTVISAWEWSNRLLWPEQLYIAGFLGGLIGGSLAYYEIKKSIQLNHELNAGTVISSDLLYILGVMGVVYFLDFLSESSILQGLFFAIVVLWFTVFAQNVIKIIWWGYDFHRVAS